MADHVFKNPSTGDTLRFLKTGADTGGELLEVEVIYTPAHQRPPAHYHPHQEERFEILSGAMTVEMSGTVHIYEAGESFQVPPGTRHAMWNAGETVTRMNWQTRPAMKTPQFFETLWGLAEAGKTGASGSPNLLQAAVLMRAYADEFRLVSPPPLIQSVLFGLLAPIGRLLGYKAHYTIP
ncbi:MAG: cupin domain-containing protein [Anaerolineae bacterium]|jgi:quercetin dioxygenase-like cupin family protein|nr:cupin domain-containing protein [Anaerolineae bacterium]